MLNPTQEEMLCEYIENYIIPCLKELLDTENQNDNITSTEYLNHCIKNPPVIFTLFLIQHAEKPDHYTSTTLLFFITLNRLFNGKFNQQAFITSICDLRFKPEGEHAAAWVKQVREIVINRIKETIQQKLQISNKDEQKDMDTQDSNTSSSSDGLGFKIR